MRVKLGLECFVNPIPERDTPEFMAWCEENDVHPGGRAWCSWLGTYLRDADYIITPVDGDGSAFLMTQDQFTKAGGDSND